MSRDEQEGHKTAWLLSSADDHDITVGIDFEISTAQLIPLHLLFPAGTAQKMDRSGFGVMLPFIPAMIDLDASTVGGFARRFQAIQRQIRHRSRIEIASWIRSQRDHAASQSCQHHLSRFATMCHA